MIVNKGREDEKDIQDYILTSPVRQRSSAPWQGQGAVPSQHGNLHVSGQGRHRLPQDGPFLTTSLPTISQPIKI